MRTTVTIPDIYHEKIEAKYKAEGFTSINDFILDLVRHYFDDKYRKDPLESVASYRKPTSTGLLPREVVEDDNPDVTPVHRCEIAFCKNIDAVFVEGVGYEDEGEVRYKKWMCDAHIKQARKAHEEVKILG